MTQHSHQHDSAQHGLNNASIDPVCGMTVKPESPHASHYQGLRGVYVYQSRGDS